jgi:hypothetical protein
MTTKKLTFHTDPAHGWLEVAIADIRELQITDLISGYSYVKGDRAFLEEDCDAYAYMENAKAKVWILNVTEKHTNGDSFVRSLSPWRA